MNNAVSPVVSVILLVMIVIGMAGSFFLWYSSVKSSEQEMGEKVKSRIFQEALASIKIIDVRNFSGKYAVVVFNNGEIKLNNISLYVNGKLDGNLSSLDINSIGEINSSIISGAGTYDLKVTSREGAEYKCRWEF